MLRKCARSIEIAGRMKRSSPTEVAIFDFIEGWYNPRRRNTVRGSLSPMEFERRKVKSQICCKFDSEIVSA